MNQLPHNIRYDVRYKIVKAIIQLCDIMLKILNTQNGCSNAIERLRHSANQVYTNIQRSQEYNYIKSRYKQKIPDRHVIMYVDEVVHDFTQENISDAVKDIILKRHKKEFINNYINDYRTRHCLWHPDIYLAQDANNQVEKNNLIDSNYEFKWKCNPNQNRCNCTTRNGEIRQVQGRLKSQQCRFIKNNKRCTRMTIFGIGICWQHLRKYYKLFIAPAEDEHGNNIGMGLYPYGNKNEILFEPEYLDKKKQIRNPNFNYNNVVARYDGERIRPSELTRRYGDCTGPYTIEDKDNDNEEEDFTARRVPMDGAFHRGVGTLVNHADEQHANTMFAMVNRHDAVTNNENEKTRGIIATKTIRASGAKSIKKLMQLPRNERNQILVDYGKKYNMDDGTITTEYVIN